MLEGMLSEEGEKGNCVSIIVSLYKTDFPIMQMHMKIAENVIEFIGATPLLHLNKIEECCGLSCKIYAKVERFNPGGSVKDRVAMQMIRDGFEKGVIKNSTLLIEATSGNTGIGIAMLGAYFGLSVTIVMPDSMSEERRKLMTAYGARIVLTPGALGMKGAIAEAERIHEENEDSIIMSQFTNLSNPKAHYLTTGPEIAEALGDNVDAFVGGIGTGGTVTGVGRYLKEKNPNVYVLGVEPASSPFLTQGIAGKHAIEGIGAGFKPDILNLDYVDSVDTVENADAKEYANLLAKKEGLLVGISSGAALCATVRYGAKNPGKTIVVLLPDTGERYLSKGLFD